MVAKRSWQSIQSIRFPGSLKKAPVTLFGEGLTPLFIPLSGNYTIMSFSKNPLSTTYFVEGNKLALPIVGIVGIAGTALLFIGIPVLVYGIYEDIRKKRE